MRLIRGWQLVTASQKRHLLDGDDMKKLIILLILLPSLCFAGALQEKQRQVIAKKNSASASTDSCTGTLLFSWHMENTDVTLGGVAGGVNNGCSVGDTTATLTSATISTTQKNDGSKSLSCGARNYFAAFDISSEDIIKHAAGTIDIWVYVDTFASGSPIVYAYIDASNVIKLHTITSGTNQFRLTHKAGGTERAATTAVSGGLTEDTWYHIIAKWDETVHTADYLNICADGTNGTTNCGAGTSALGTWAGDLTALRIGDPNLVTGIATFIDNIKIYSTWQ